MTMLRSVPRSKQRVPLPFATLAEYVGLFIYLFICFVPLQHSNSPPLKEPASYIGSDCDVLYFHACDDG